MKTIENASAKEIVEYLDYLYNTALDKAFCDGMEVFDNNIWKRLYSKVFSDEISRAICKKFPDFNWYDPDTAYYEDVIAFIEAFKNYVKNISNESESDELFPSINTYFENKDN